MLSLSRQSGQDPQVGVYRKLWLPLTLCAFLLTACPIEDDEALDAGTASEGTFVDDTAGDPSESESSDTDTDFDATDDPIDADDDFDRRDGCDPETIGEEAGPVTAIYAVIDGQLGELCHGEASEELTASWDLLAAFAPLSVRSQLGVVAGFTPEVGNETGTIAFAGPIDEFDNSEFLVALDLQLAADDPGEMALTLAHEISHVFTSTPDQLDITVSADECSTFFNGYGCFSADSYMQAWVDQFWSQERLDALPASGQPDEELGDEYCSIDPTILGAYAASHPEEDFAESFSAFVFEIEVPDPVDPRIDFFTAYPELVEYRDNARASDQPEVENTFVLCG